MGFNEFLSSIFGNKSTRDMKEIKPWVEKIKAAYPEIEALDNDALRAKTEELKKYIFPAVRRPVTKGDFQLRVFSFRGGHPFADVARRQVVFFFEGIVKSAQAAETGSHGDIHDPQFCVRQKIFCQKQTTGLQILYW